MLVYPDQNALINLGLKSRSDRSFRKKLDDKIKDGLQFVVSLWHLVEGSNTKNIDSATQLADFIDSLNPLWIYERIDLQKLEVRENLYDFLKLKFERTPRISTKAAVVGALFGKSAGDKYNIPSRDFVRQWINKPEQRDFVVKGCQVSVDALLKNRELAASGKITDEVRRVANQKRFSMTLPNTTPSGLDIGNESRDEFLAQARTNSIPSFAVEDAIANNEWGADAHGKADANTLIDKFHLISALPYVDEIISNDNFFHSIYPIAQKSGHVKAVVRKTEDFIAQL